MECVEWKHVPCGVRVRRAESDGVAGCQIGKSHSRIAGLGARLTSGSIAGFLVSRRGSDAVGRGIGGSGSAGKKLKTQWERNPSRRRDVVATSLSVPS